MAMHHSGRLRRIIQVRWGVPGGLRAMMLRALDDVDRGALGAGCNIVREIIADLRAMEIPRKKGRESPDEDDKKRGLAHAA